MNNPTSRSKDKVLCFVDYYLPGFKAGGPIRSISNLSDKVSPYLDFKIVARDRDIDEGKPFSGILTNSWNSVSGSSIFYLKVGVVYFLHLFRVVKSKEHDVVYINSFFSLFFSFFPLIFSRILNPSISIILSPRGEFSPGALSIKHFKKSIFISVFKFIGFHKLVFWHLTSEIDVKYLLKIFPDIYTKKIFVSSNFPNKINKSLSILVPKPRSLKICFLSRVSKKKNLDFALQSLMMVQSNVIFTIYGTIEDGAYWEYCLSLIERLPNNINVVYYGHISNNLVNSELARHDLFFFPTRGENFGHVIIEALSAGLPVLISDQTPWSLIKKNEFIRIYSLSDPKMFASDIDDLASLGAGRLHNLKLSAFDFASDYSEDPNLLDLYLKMFAKASNLTS